MNMCYKKKVTNHKEIINYNIDDLLKNIKKMILDEKEYLKSTREKYNYVTYKDKDILSNDNLLPSIYLGKNEYLFDYLVYINYLDEEDTRVFLNDFYERSGTYRIPFLYDTRYYNSLFIGIKRYKMIDSGVYIPNNETIFKFYSNSNFSDTNFDLRIEVCDGLVFISYFLNNDFCQKQFICDNYENLKYFYNSIIENITFDYKYYEFHALLELKNVLENRKKIINSIV
jgi:hypothetical protein